MARSLKETMETIWNPSYSEDVYHIFLFFRSFFLFNKKLLPEHPQPSNIVPQRDNHRNRFLLPSSRHFLPVKCLMWSATPDRRISADRVLSIYNGVDSEAALTSMVISEAGSHLLLYSWPARFPFFFGHGLTIIIKNVTRDPRLSFHSYGHGLCFITALFGLAHSFFFSVGFRTAQRNRVRDGKAKSVYNQT